MRLIDADALAGGLEPLPLIEALRAAHREGDGMGEVERLSIALPGRHAVRRRVRAPARCGTRSRTAVAGKDRRRLCTRRGSFTRATGSPEKSSASRMTKLNSIVARSVAKVRT